MARRAAAGRLATDLGGARTHPLSHPLPQRNGGGRGKGCDATAPAGSCHSTRPRRRLSPPARRSLPQPVRLAPALLRWRIGELAAAVSLSREGARPYRRQASSPRDPNSVANSAGPVPRVALARAAGEMVVAPPFSLPQSFPGRIVAGLPAVRARRASTRGHLG